MEEITITKQELKDTIVSMISSKEGPVADLLHEVPVLSLSLIVFGVELEKKLFKED